MKVLIIGFPRSGTSLTYRIFKRHKDIQKMYYESLILWRHWDKNIYNLFPGFGKGQNGGEKIIHEKRFIGKTKDTKFYEYCDLWNKLFKDEAKIIQIVRHPYDQWNSIVKKKYKARRLIDKIPRQLKIYFNYLPETVEKIISQPNSLSIKYEDLTLEPKLTIKKMYEHCGLDPTRTAFQENIRKGKTFWYKSHGHNIDNDNAYKSVRNEYWDLMNRNVHKIISIYNKIEGVEYKK